VEARLDLFQNGRGQGRQTKGRRQGKKAAAFTPAPPHTRPFPLTHDDGLYAGGGLDSLGNAWTLQFPSMPGCLRLRMQAKEKKQGPTQSEA